MSEVCSAEIEECEMDTVEAYRTSLNVWLNHPDFPGWIDFQAWGCYAMQTASDSVLKYVTPTPSESLILFTNFCVAFFVTSALFLGTNAIFNLVWPSFAKINPSHKKLYVVANLFKSLVLGLQCSSISWLYYSMKEYGCTVNLLGFEYECNWSVDPGHVSLVKQVCIMYVITDVVALVLVPKLPFSTKLHHYATSAFLAWVMLIDIAASPIAQKLMLYGFWSTLAYPVNAFLALRVMYSRSAWLALLVYVVCCGANWSLHLLWLLECMLKQELSAVQWACTLLYLGAISALVNDDLKLMHWLRTFDPENHRGASEKVEAGATSKTKAG